MTSPRDAHALAHIVAGALEHVNPRARVVGALARRLDKGPGSRAHPRVTVIAIGKVAPAMAAGALDGWPDTIDRVLVVTSDGTDASALEHEPCATVLRAGHPIPDARSVRAAERCLALARAEACRDRVVLVLVSGGASALVCAPIEGVTLRQKQAITRAMLRSGATIQDINLARKHLSRIKGGGLARAAFPARVITLAVSDVIGGTIADVGSGPSVGDRSSVRRARQLLRIHAPRFADVPLRRTGLAPNVIVERVIGSPEESARVVATELRRRGLEVRVLPASQACASTLADEYVGWAKRLRAGHAVVRAAEPALVVPARAGEGGRSTHVAALVALALPRDALFVAYATDGVDGRSGTSGAAVDGALMERLGEAAIFRAVQRYDTGRLHREAKTALPLRPSGTNFADLHVLVKTSA